MTAPTDGTTGQPTARVGVLGGGQLGRMLGLAATPLAIESRFLDPAEHAPAAAAGRHTRSAWSDRETLTAWARGIDVATFEFENVPVETVRVIQQLVPVFPPPHALATAQDRLNEKQLFERLDIGVPPFVAVSNEAELATAIETVGLPAVVKTRRMGYDGKGQAVIREASDVPAAWRAMADGARMMYAIVEGFVRFDRELSIIAVRGRDGAFAAYPLNENVHRDGILRVTRAPAPNLDPATQATAEALARHVMEHLQYVGVLAIELFDVGGRLLANEIAPRVHNSGHWTIEGATTSQFENHMRAVAGLPLGVATARGQCTMFNLIGDTPPLADLLAVDGAHVHLYGKAPRPGRKIGHVTLVDADRTAIERVQALTAM